MVWWLYYFMMYLLYAFMRISALWNDKSKLWITGRQDWRKRIADLPAAKGKRIWFHVSSLGEFEQARPVMELLSKWESKPDLILTFFSPSGFTIRSGYPLAKVMYLPADLPGNATHWVKSIKPDLAVFVKYDLWPGYLKALQKAEIPAILISANWSLSNRMASWKIPPTRSLLKAFKAIFLQQSNEIDAFRQLGWTNIHFGGDTRIDRCLELPSEVKSRVPEILHHSAPFDLVAGSTWPRDEELLQHLISTKRLNAIIAPHDTSPANVKRLMDSWHGQCVRLSELRHRDDLKPVVIIDSIGLLSVLYALGKVAYVGGGFGKGIHNILEPMAHKRPVIFGPKYEKFPEAVAMVSRGGAQVVHNAKTLIDAYQQISDTSAYAHAVAQIEVFLEKNRGASQKVVNSMMEIIPCGA